MSIIDNVKKIAKENKKTIVLPESMDERVLKAAEIIADEKIADIIVLGNKEKILKTNPSLERIKIIDPNESELTNDIVDKFYELRKHKGMTLELSRETLLNDYMYYACMLVKCGMADGVVSGACHTTSNTLRPALQIIKNKALSKLVSSFFLMIVPNCEYGENGTFLFTDCGLNQNPDSEALAAIAHDSAKSFELLVNAVPKIGFLSHSTYGSANHDDVDKVKNAVKIANEKYPEYLMDGEFQLDAAIIPSVAESKAPGNKLNGQANVLVFPTLDAGNIGYKLVQRLAKAEAYGPVCQGMASPVNDLSRGCSPLDIVGTVAITAVQALNKDVE